ncbi:hypothetical protein RSAG8_11465, partial [Rhizoctonia solani AG-8 WAC10335]
MTHNANDTLDAIIQTMCHDMAQGVVLPDKEPQMIDWLKAAFTHLAGKAQDGFASFKPLNSEYRGAFV